MGNDYRKEVEQLQAWAMADLEEELLTVPADPLRAQRTLLLISLIKARHAKKMTQADLAARVGTRQSAIARIESGKGNPTMKSLLTIAKALDVNLVLE